VDAVIGKKKIEVKAELPKGSIREAGLADQSKGAETWMSRAFP
jgi:hypothetical protein